MSPPLQLSYKLALCFPAPEGVVTHREQNASGTNLEDGLKNILIKTPATAPKRQGWGAIGLLSLQLNSML